MTAATQPDVCIYWDNSNIFVPAQDVAKEREGAIVGRDLRIQFDAMYELARAGRKVVAGVCVGSLPPELDTLWTRLRGVGVDLELFERGEETHREQAVDQALQVHMLRAIVDRPPGVAVLLTGDGAGAHEGVGADLNLTHRGCGRFLGLPGGSSCTHTRTGFEPCSCTSSWAGASA
ncbi:MAG: NYN domain-containing protein [Methylotenera sp.]|nr:NYN domain-containing protein [Methylotenera sp.]